MWAVSEMIDKAREVIFILVSLCVQAEDVSLTPSKDWWLTPELYLRRPAAYFPEWRLDRLLQRKAQEGVKIHVIVYKEVRTSCASGSIDLTVILDYPNHVDEL